ncbi:Ppx/GppA phosphatase family protein [Arthrobacter sp. CAN_A214]|uniref:Ppx/GppA phosphatase family protein n=1 Tax=Arthrobacter sp. CAN_A214 TaxID=2787720 RepID=UPI002FF3F519
MMRTAAIDCGTNSIRLLIADIDETGALTDVERLMRVVRLGEGVDATGRLSDAALARTFTAAEEYAELIVRHGSPAVRFVATSASRDAENREDFMSGIRARLGVDPEVISGAEEAALSFTGAVSVLGAAEDETVLVIDLGGGSTEFVAGDSSGVLASRSMDMGCVRFTERFLHGDPPTRAEISAMEAEVRSLIAVAAADVPLGTVTTLVGVAGSITTVTAHALKLTEYIPERIHGAVLSTAEVQAASADLLHSDRARRASLPYMHPGRVDVIGAGALIWKCIVEAVAEATQGRVGGATASEHDILDGIALSVARRGK